MSVSHYVGIGEVACAEETPCPTYCGHCPLVSDTIGAATSQLPPVKNALPAMQDLVIEDIALRKKVGLQRYGTLLQPHNGRDMLLDAYQEALDLCVYLRGVLYERDGA